MKKRSNQILELLADENKMEVSLLAEKLGVSQVTIRKDLDELESKGIIVREHGFALLRSMDDINGRIAYHYEAKRKIAQKAEELISDGDTIMIESGSCCALLADTLTISKKDLTIIIVFEMKSIAISRRVDFIKKAGQKAGYLLKVQLFS